MAAIGEGRFRDAELRVEARVSDLLARLSPEEKAGQLTTLSLPDDGRPDVLAQEPPPGLVIAPRGHWRDTAARIRDLQKQFAAAGEWGIPALVITLGDFSGAVRFPIPIACSAAWDHVLMEDIAAATAFEARAGGAAARWGPVVAPAVGPRPVAHADRDQTLGGDVLLAAELAAAHVRGAQGPAPGRIRPDGGAVVLTHVGAMASQLAGHPSGAHERSMRSSVLVPAEAAVRAGAQLVVPTSAANAGVPGHADSWLLRDVLRRDWAFDGVVLAAVGAVEGLVDRHRVATDPDTAHALALEAGVDVVGTRAAGPAAAIRLVRLLRQGSLPRWLLDDAVAAVLRLKIVLGLFEDADPRDPGARVGGTAHRELARRATAESLVLLADGDDVLPLAGVPAVDVLCADPGGAVPDTGRLARALAVAMPGCVVRDRGGSDAVQAPDLAGTVVAVVTGDPRSAGTAISRIVAGGRRCVALICSGDVDGAPTLASTTAAVLLCWQSIAEQAGAVADVLAGTAEPGGRLPFALDGDGVDLPARYPLGYGRGYTTFEYSHLHVTPDPVAATEALIVQFRLTNTGARPGKEVVQVYLHDRVSSVARPSRMLVGFAAVRLGPGRSRTVRITVPAMRFAVWDRAMRRVVEPGEFDVLVGASTIDVRLTGSFTVRPGALPSAGVG